MASLPQRACTHPLCPAYVTRRGKCDKHQPKQHTTQDKKDRDKFYNGSKWKSVRKIVLYKEPLCRMCQHTGTLTEATVVDHIIRKEHMPDPYHVPGLMPLCHSCHSRKTNDEAQYYSGDTQVGNNLYLTYIKR